MPTWKIFWDYAVDDAGQALQERGIADAYLVAHKLINFNLPIDACYF